MQIGIASIYIDNSLDLRDKINLDAVDTYAEIFDQLPDIIVFDVEPPADEMPEGYYYLADGLHRLEAAKKLQKTEIGADIKKGTLKEAKAYALKANLTHGLPLTRSERARATKRMIMLYPERSDSWIAQDMGISHHSVRKYREELESTWQIAKLDLFIGKDGKERPREVPHPERDKSADETPEMESEPQDETTSKPQEKEEATSEIPAEGVVNKSHAKWEKAGYATKEEYDADYACMMSDEDIMSSSDTTRQAGESRAEGEKRKPRASDRTAEAQAPPPRPKPSELGHPEGWDTYIEYYDWIKDYGLNLASQEDIQSVSSILKGLEILTGQLKEALEELLGDI
jgi:ParB-like chromosome segregation protein Spo0J